MLTCGSTAPRPSAIDVFWSRACQSNTHAQSVHAHTCSARARGGATKGPGGESLMQRGRIRARQHKARDRRHTQEAPRALAAEHMQRAAYSCRPAAPQVSYLGTKRVTGRKNKKKTTAGAAGPREPGAGKTPSEAIGHGESRRAGH